MINNKRIKKFHLPLVGEWVTQTLAAHTCQKEIVATDCQVCNAHFKNDNYTTEKELTDTETKTVTREVHYGYNKLVT